MSKLTYHTTISFLMVLFLNAVNVNSLFYIQSVDTGLVLDLADQNACADARVIMCPFQNRASQMWEFYNLTMLKNHYSGYFMDIKGGMAAGSEVIVWPGHGSKNQQWVFQVDGTVKNGMNLVLDVADMRKDPGAQVIGFEHTGADNQRFKVINV
ncbi:hypothetical protein CHUAL_007762 [Chamberlinius hualienensis]